MKRGWKNEEWKTDTEMQWLTEEANIHCLLYLKYSISIEGIVQFVPQKSKYKGCKQTWLPQ